MKESQRSFLAARLKPYYAALAKKRQQASGGDRKSEKSVMVNSPQPIEGGKSSDEAGAAFGVSGKSVDRAAYVLAAGSAKVIEAVEQGTADQAG